MDLFAAGGRERLLQRSEQIGVRRIDGEVDGLDRISVEVVELPLIGDRLGAVRRAGRAARPPGRRVNFVGGNFNTNLH